MPSLAAAAAAVAANAAGEGVDIVAAAKATAAECRYDYQDLSEIAYIGGLVNGQLPDAARHRTSLLALGLQRAGMACLPAISHLVLLGTLDVSCNAVSALPDSLSSLQRLEIIDFSDNKIQELPSSLFTLTSLKQLIAYKNGIGSVPDAIALLTRLEQINLYARAAVPPIRCVACSKTEFWFCISGALPAPNSSIRRYNNNLARMPPALHLPLLQQLNVAANHLRALPDMSACPSIVRVAAYWNRISVFPLNHPIPNLESLELQRNVLHLGKLLPQSHDIALQFSSLTRLNLSNNAMPQLQVHPWTSIAACLFGCGLNDRDHATSHTLQAELLPPSLEEILLRSCGISSITHGVGHCEPAIRPLFPRLRTLNLSQNYLKTIPLCFMPPTLVTLDVCNNHLADLPAELAAIKGLWNLFVNGNRLGCLPLWIVELDALRRFTFAGNPIPPYTTPLDLQPHLSLICFCSSVEQRQLAANVQMSINLRELARQGA
jgi:Leucine-rich repeat (LRR) protein